MQLKYLWEATFNDDHMISQPADDRYSKHNDEAEHNPSAFRDLLDYQETSPLQTFALVGQDRQIYAVSLQTGEFFVNGTTFMLDQPLEELTDRKLIYFRTKRMDMQTREQYTHSYTLGYEGTNAKGKREQKMITVR